MYTARQLKEMTDKELQTVLQPFVEAHFGRKLSHLEKQALNANIRFALDKGIQYVLGFGWEELARRLRN